MKNKAIALFQFILGWKNYLFLFTVLKIPFLKLSVKKQHYLFFTEQFSDTENIVIIGACTGITTIPLAKRVKNAFVYAFEPAPSNFDVLQKVIRFFNLSNVKLFPWALGNKNEEVTIILPVVGKAKKQGLVHVVDPSITSYNKGITFKVPMRRLDDIAELKDKKFHGLKIIAENYEIEILLGAKLFILENKPLIYCELWDNAKRQHVLDLIKSWGYQILVHSSGKLVHYHPLTCNSRFFLFKYE